MLGLRYALFARHARSHDAQKATARALMRALGKSLRRCAHTPATITCNAKPSVLAARQRALFCDMMNLDPCHQRMAANSARASGPMHLA
jgi:hypothetical protein